MNFRNFNSIAVFIVVARHMNMGRAAAELNLTKGAVSYQIQKLEQALEFNVFERVNRQLNLTREGAALLNTSTKAYSDIELEITRIKQSQTTSISIGVATYFASRWLSPKLMNFMDLWPEINLRINPLIDLINVDNKDVDLLIRWGKGEWQDPRMKVELILKCPAMLTASGSLGQKIEELGIESILESQPLLDDREGSSAWHEWFESAGIEEHASSKRLVIQDPNVRAQAVIDGQGLALYDDLIIDDIEAGRLYQYSRVKLNDYGFYLIYPETAGSNSAVIKFRDWIINESNLGG